ncbi:MAG: hypothetical protein ACRCRT_01210 [Cetobacterium somerae]
MSIWRKLLISLYYDLKMFETLQEYKCCYNCVHAVKNYAGHFYGEWACKRTDITIQLTDKRNTKRDLLFKTCGKFKHEDEEIRNYKTEIEYKEY